jgi:hypothetical protein
MGMMDQRPFLSSYSDRHGKRRWRFRRNGAAITLPGQPGDAKFEAAYLAAIEGRANRSADVVTHPGSAAPRSLKAAWRLVASTSNADWTRLRDSSQKRYIDAAERLLDLPIGDGPRKWESAQVDEVRRRHVKAMLGQVSSTPHEARLMLVALRKIMEVALDQEWITADPTYRLRYEVKTKGWRAWTDDERAKFEAYWPLGSTPRTTYALALYTTQRKADIARYEWADFGGDDVRVVQGKTGKVLILPVVAPLRDALDAAPRHHRCILINRYGEPFSIHSLSGMMREWTKKAGIAAGATIHGLRKTAGKLMAEGQATTRELMDALGHDSIAHAELYSREADQARLAKSAFRKMGDRLRPRLKVVGGEPDGEPSG